MARATTRTLLPLDRWAEVIGMDPLHFNQITVPTIRENAHCATVWKQYAWQEYTQVAREDVAHAIKEAEDQVARQVGYKLLPTWELDERTRAVRPGFAELLAQDALDLRGFRSSIQTDWAHFISGGVERKSLIESAVTIIYSDNDGDGYFETATIVTATDQDAEGNSVTDDCEVAVYYPGESGSDEWEVRPLRSVTISGGVITITMWRHQLVLPELMSVLSPEAVGGLDDSNFLATVDVYRHYNDPQTQVQFLWSPRPDTCDCGSSTCPSCTNTSQYGCLLAQDWRRGLVSYSPATWDSDDEEFDSADWTVCRAPDKLRLWYYAGHRDMAMACPVLQMSRQLERAVVYYSIALLDRPLCGCDNIERVARRWSEELGLNESNPTGSASYQLAARHIGNPFGTTRGGLFAWEAVMAGSIAKPVRY